MPMGSLLRSDSTESLRSSALYIGGYPWPIWGHLIDSVKTGESARALLTGNKDFEHVERDPVLAALFNQNMSELTRILSKEIVQVYDFSQMKRIVDVGGGYGGLMAAVLTANPGTHGVLFDLPHATEGARRQLSAAGLGERCEVVGGNFFESIPSQSDAYLLGRVIHVWNDERAELILTNCRRAIMEKGKPLLIERIFPERMKTTAAHQAIARSDLNMLVGPGGRERTENEFQTLFHSARFQLNRILPLELSFNLIEAIPV